MNADESDLTPQPLPDLRRGRAAGRGRPSPSQRELWPFFVVAGRCCSSRSRASSTGAGRAAGRLGAAPRARRSLGARRCAARWSSCCSLALTRPTLPRWVDRLNVVFLLDLSDSVSLAARESAYRFAAAVGGEHAAGRPAGVIVFGEEAVVDQPLQPGRQDRPAEGPGRRARHELWRRRSSSALATLPPGQANRFVLLTDGRQNAGQRARGARRRPRTRAPTSTTCRPR